MYRLLTAVYNVRIIKVQNTVQKRRAYMLAVNYTNLRENMKNYMDKVTDDYETMIVTRKNNTGLWNQRNSYRKEKQVFIS